MTNSRALLLYVAVNILYMISCTNANEDDKNCTDAQRLNGPVIIPCQSEIILEKEQNFTLTCKGKTEIQFMQQEIPEEVIGDFNKSLRNTYKQSDEYKFETVLELYNVDQFTIGYYACFDNTVNGSDILNNLIEEPNNTEHIAFIYIYVNGSESLFAPMREVIVPRKQCKVVIECRPTTPDVEVTLMSDIPDPIYKEYSPKIGFIIDNDMLSDPLGSYFMYRTITCEFQNQDTRNEKEVLFQPIKVPPKPRISGGDNRFLKNEIFTINCTVEFQPDSVVNLFWRFPENVPKESVKEVTNKNSVVDGGIWYSNITVVNATKQHEGFWTCMSKNNCGNEEKRFKKKYLAKPLLEVKPPPKKKVVKEQNQTLRIAVEVYDYPTSNYRYLYNNLPLPVDDSKYSVYRDRDDVMLAIFKTKITDTGNYTLVVNNGDSETQNTTFDVRILAPPVVDFGPNVDKKYMENITATLKCEVMGYPPPDIEWIFSNGEDQVLRSTRVKVVSAYKMIAYLDIPIHVSGTIMCKASNEFGTTEVTRRLLVYEMSGGFGIKNEEKTWFSQDQNVTITCLASKYDFDSVTWLGSDELDLNGTDIVQYSTNQFSLVAKLQFPHISLNQSGVYFCRGKKLLSDSYTIEHINISVAALQVPVIIKPTADQNIKVQKFQPIKFSCLAEGVPPPKLDWYKDDVYLTNSTPTIYTNMVNRTVINSTIEITQMLEEYKGVYKCLADSGGVIAFRTYSLELEVTAYAVYLSVILVIILVLILVVLYLTWKVHKEKKRKEQLRRELAAAGLLYFKEGVTKSLNPELGIDEQAELLPYDEKFEFPADKLILGKQLGAGAFGVVYKAEARGIINAEETNEVAVKMVKKTADNMYIKALASELKIMVHLGKHINIVNLLGACTKNVGKRELIVIVEYCKFGNIHNYMLRHREVFIDQLTDNNEKNLGRVNRGFSCSSGSTGAHSDYFAANTQDTDHTFVNTANTNRSTRKVSEGYVQPEWRTNYESDYSFDGRNPRPLTSRDLLAWAFQIARGMEYLASRKVLHGDLAARNILLAEDNVVKICDFGLARSIYKNDEYQKQENALLPFKWLAIECMTDRIFSTQSDVWAYGIVLWEMFSLAKTPYPNMVPASLLQWLSEGNRLAKPTYADDRIYNVMMRCWEQKPTSRPSFSQLQEIIGGFLEDNVRNHYVDLNSAFMDGNTNPEHEDYLAMVCSPDYNNLVTPSPHHYANDRSFFPTTPTQIDKEGYLQMSPASRQNKFTPSSLDSKFDFDARKFNPKVSEASSCGSELTPMLTLNNLPARSGSESDHEGNASPYLNMCPRIEEETDDVFERNQNNAKNSAVTNPTYITLDVDIEKKPKDIINSYINVPNGLVK